MCDWGVRAACVRVLHMCAHVCVSSRVSTRCVLVQPRYGASIHSVSEHEVVRTTGTGVGRISPACVVGQTKKTRMSCVCVAVCVRHWSRVFWVCASLCVSVFVFLLLWMHATLPALCACVCVRSAGSAVLHHGHGGRVMQHGVRGVRHRAQQAHTCYTHCPSNAARHCLPLQAALHDRNYSYASQCTPLHFSEPCHQIVVTMFCESHRRETERVGHMFAE